MHHANLLIGTEAWALAQIPKAERTESQDVFITHYSRMSVVDARKLLYDTSLRPVEREYRTFVLIVDSILHEAQNTLLKLFEEPNEHTLFYLVIPRTDMLLPTLLSRLHILGAEENIEDQKTFNTFLKLGYQNRLKIIGEKLVTEDNEWLTEFLHGLEKHAQMSRDAKLIREVLFVVSYIQAPGSSKKMLLEHIALTV